LDKGLFEMLLTNLIGNAAKYNTSPQPCVDIRFARRNRSLIIGFADNGVGIAKGELKRIFGKFYRSPRSDSPAVRGSGLGLYLVQQIARLHKGKVVAQSAGVGKGSVFTLQLPLIQA
jgi:signal transduction histidine kinase